MSWKLQLDPIKCAGHGYCAEILPERITLDDWGYPMIDAEAIDADLEEHARRAVAECPVFALKLERVHKRHAA